MTPRGTIIAGLVLVEVAILGEAYAVLRGTPSAPFAAHGVAAAVSGPNLEEGGPHTVFEVGPRPSLTVDIGLADLTIVSHDGAQMDVTASKSSDYGFLRAKSPITVRKDGETVRIATDGRSWGVGDDRMVTAIVPPQTQVTVVSAGDIKATGLRADASFSSTGRGTIDVEDYDGVTLRARSRNGLISLHRIVASRLDVASRNDRVEATGLQVHDGSVASDGSTMLGFSPGADTLITAQTDDGHVAASGFGSAGAAERRQGEDGDTGSASRSVRVGAGHGHFDVHANSGNIVLTQES